MPELKRQFPQLGDILGIPAGIFVSVATLVALDYFDIIKFSRLFH